MPRTGFSSKKNKTFIWNDTLDNLLSELVSNIEMPQSWAKIAAQLEIKIRKLGINCFPKRGQCRERWVNHLDPSVSKRPFTAAEIAYICNKKEELELKGVQGVWVEIAKILGRSPNEVKHNHLKNKTPKKQTKKNKSQTFSDQFISPVETNLPIVYPGNSSKDPNTSTCIVYLDTDTDTDTDNLVLDFSEFDKSVELSVANSLAAIPPPYLSYDTPHTSRFRVPTNSELIQHGFFPLKPVDNYPPVSCIDEELIVSDTVNMTEINTWFVND